MSETPNLTPAGRGQKLTKVFDAAMTRLLEELEGGDFKAAHITQALDLLRFAEFDPRKFIVHDNPQTTQCQSPAIAKKIEALRHLEVDHLTPILGEHDKANQTSLTKPFPPPLTESL